jgi:hypothetical protein
MAVDWKRLIGLEGPGKGSGATGLGPDFPESAGDRERGKFRESGYPRLTAVAVVGDDGNQIGTALVPSFEELIEEIRKLRLALTLQGTAADLGDL